MHTCLFWFYTFSTRLRIFIIPYDLCEFFFDRLRWYPTTQPLQWFSGIFSATFRQQPQRCLWNLRLTFERIYQPVSKYWKKISSNPASNLATFVWRFISMWCIYLSDYLVQRHYEIFWQDCLRILANIRTQKRLLTSQFPAQALTKHTATIVMIGTIRQYIAAFRHAVILPRRNTIKNPRVAAIPDTAINIPRIDAWLCNE